jgi:BMFP domain-containing protein YqiC
LPEAAGAPTLTVLLTQLPKGAKPMQTRNARLDDVANLMTQTLGLLQGAGDEAKAMVRAQAERFVADLDLPGREELEVAKDLAAAARAETEALRAELDALRARVEALEAGRAGL